jgi:hypothetical protein
VSISGDSRGYLLRSRVGVPVRFHRLSLQCRPISGKHARFFPLHPESCEFLGANPAPEGIVVIFDSADGIAGATMAEIQRDLYGAAGVAKSQGIWSRGAAELFAGAFSEGTEGSGGPMAEIQRMVKGEVSREAFWTQSYLDPVEAFRGTGHP